MTISQKTICDLHQDFLARFSPEDALRALRTEVHALLQVEKPAPYSSRPPHLDVKRVLTHTETRELHLFMREGVTEKEYIAAERARAKATSASDMCRDAHHHVQKLHGISLWEEADKRIAEALGKAKKS